MNPGSNAFVSETSVTPAPLALTEVAPGSLIYAMPNALPRRFCDQLIERFEANPDDHHVGRIGQDAHEDRSVKRSTDLLLSGKAHWNDVDQRLFRSLQIAVQSLAATHAFFRGQFKDLGYGLQRTLPGEFYHWHVDGGSHDFADRQLVAIWYLNDVPGPGGETEFRHQQVKITPEAGKLVLFPPFWTHEHRGTELARGSKYIATTWLLFA